MSKPKEVIKNSEIDDIKNDLNSLKDNVVELTRSLNGSSKPEELKEAVMQRAEKLKQTGKDNIDTAATRIQDNPLSSIAMAFAAGAVISFLAGRK